MNPGPIGVLAITAALIILTLVLLLLMTAGVWLYSQVTHTLLPRTRRLQLIFGVTALVLVPLIITVVVVNL